MSKPAFPSTSPVNLTELEHDSRFRWAIKDHAAVAIWRDKTDNSDSILRHLGNRTPHNQEQSNIHIWVGEDAENNQLLIVLVIRIRLRASRKCSPRTMFLVIPSESLRIDTTTPTFGDLSQYDVPPSLLDHPSDKCSADSARILHIACVLDHDQSSMAIMPKAEYPGPVVGQPLLLLQSLKSLAEAHKFDVYLNYNTYAHRHLGEIQSVLVQSNLCTPSIDLPSMYALRGGSVGNWSAQGWCADDEPAPAYKRRKIVPSYDATTDAAEHCLPPYSPKGDRVVVPQSCTPEPIVFANEPASYVPDTPVARNQDGEQERLGPTPLVGHVLVIDDLVHADHQSPDIQDLGKSSPFAAPVLANAQLAPRGLAATKNLESHVAIEPVLAPRPNAYLSDITPNTTGPLSSRIYIDMCLWLTKAWKFFPEAHYIFSDQLLAMGAAAYDNDEALYARRRAECTTELLYYRAQTSGPVCVNDGMDFLREYGHSASVAPRRERVVKQETTRIISWMNSIRPYADLHLMDDCLTTLAAKGIRLIEFGQTGSCGEDDWVTLLDEFNRWRGFCVAEICLTFGGKSLARLDDVVTKS